MNNFVRWDAACMGSVVRALRGLATVCACAALTRLSTVGKALIKFIVESKHKKSGMVDITDDAAAAELAGKLMGERYA